MPAYMRIDVKRLPASDVAGELFLGEKEYKQKKMGTIS